jgi:hypothetical protein
MHATLTAKTIKHPDENGDVAYLEVVGGVEGGKLSLIKSIGDRQYKNLSAICDRELARVGLANQEQYQVWMKKYGKWEAQSEHGPLTLEQAKRVLGSIKQFFDPSENPSKILPYSEKP